MIYGNLVDFGIKTPQIPSQTFDPSNLSQAFVEVNGHDYGPKPFKVFDEWFNREGVDKIIEEAWADEVKGRRLDCNFRDRLKNVKFALKRWSTNTFGGLDKELNDLKEEAMEWEMKAECQQLNDSEMKLWLDCRRRWIEKEKVKASMLKQKARIRWVLEGDENSKFFHSSIRRRYNKSNIRGLIVNGVWTKNPSEVKLAVFEHYKNLFGQNRSSRLSFIEWADGGPEHFNETVGIDVQNESYRPFHVGEAEVGYRLQNETHSLSASSVISASQRVELESQFTEEEIWGAVKDCASNKAPGPDGFNLRFYKKFWSVIKGDLVEAIKSFWLNGKISDGCNASFITLIPKKSDPLNLNDYRPISLIGSFYKVVAKLLSNRLKKVIPQLVGFEQTAFIKGRNIIDGALIANETLEYLKQKRLKSLVFKVDFEKAFDCLSWDFLMEIMEIMGFGMKWRKWIMSCLKSASTSILVNGSPTNEFKLERGVRQGDPLSPFLYILAAEGLNLLTKSAVRKKLYNGVEIGRDKIQISNLQYADDTIFFGTWSANNIDNLMKILKCFELASGLKVNYNKSNLFGVNVDHMEVAAMANLFGCKVGKFPSTYLGLPIGANMNKMESWKPVINKFEKRLADWKASSMSFGGRLTLVNSVLNSLPLYFFSLFRAPQCVLKNLECVRRIFFWGGSGKETKIPWVKWDEVLLPFEEGGLNLGALKSSNLALIGKWWWRFKIETTSLWVRVIRSIYGDSGGLISGGNFLSKNSCWTNIIKAGGSIESVGIPFLNSFRRNIGSGKDTSFWLDPWLGDTTLKSRFGRLFKLDSDQNALVSDRVMWNGSFGLGTWQWRRSPSGRSLNELDELNELLKQVQVTEGRQDSWGWLLSKNGRYETHCMSVLLNSKILVAGTNRFETMKNNLVPKKVEVFIWRTRKRRLPVLTELDKRGIDLNSTRCPVCDDDVKTVDHSILFCKEALGIWAKVYDWWGLSGAANVSIGETFGENPPNTMSGIGAKIWQAVKWTCGYLVWKNRNQKIFRKKCWSIPVALNEIQVTSYEWIAKRCKSKHIDWHNWLHSPQKLHKIIWLLNDREAIDEEKKDMKDIWLLDGRETTDDIDDTLY
ncbi:uncharacterized protein [Rutidosis leptorrhynchoides]|uniref:uncharacterized protein n=1 Tax=Rutidosis leptorrhynchoides TaxID=125765 RepID=UPI003A9A0BB1